jgi:aspartate racemase
MKIRLARGARAAGLVGGLGPESTIDYYRRIVELWKATHPGSLPPLLIDSLDVNRGIELVRNDRDGLIDYLRGSVERLARAGCEFAAMAANTTHIVFDELAARCSIPLLSIVEACAAETRARSIQRVGLLGTGFTMEAGFYSRVFAREGIDVRVPDAQGRSWLHERYLGELLNGVFLDETREGVLRIIGDLVERDEIEAVVLAGTELPLLIRADAIAGLLMLDTTEIHAGAIVRRLRELPGHENLDPVGSVRKQYYFRQSGRGLLAWDVDRLIQLSRHLPRKRIPLEQIQELDEEWFGEEEPATWRAMLEHVKLIEEADRAYPIIVSASGAVMDGMHRVAQAVLEGRREIEAVQFVDDPEPDHIGLGPEDLSY